MYWFSLFGRFDLTGSEIFVGKVQQSRHQSLLAYLALFHEKTHSRESLAYMLWPEKTDQRARANLRKSIHHLRQAVPDFERILCVDQKTIRWCGNDICTVDTQVFEEKLERAENAEAYDAVPLIQEALELYTGDLFPSCYDDWIIAERDKFHHRYINALGKLIQLLEQRRDYEEAVQVARQLLRHDPFNEGAYRHLMRLHSLNSDLLRVSQVYDEYVTKQKREFDVGPSAETKELYNRLTKASSSKSQLTDQQSYETVDDFDYPLVGRIKEWQQLELCWTNTKERESHFVLISGESGIGKTRLASEFMKWAKLQGFAVAYTRSYEAEGDLAYAPASELLRTDEFQTHLSELDSLWLSELSRLVPEILVERPDLPRPLPMTEPWQRQRLFAALAESFLSLNQPLLLVFDDLQWCDNETIEWLQYLLRTVSDQTNRLYPLAKIVVIGMARPETIDGSHPLTSLLLNLQRNASATEVKLENLQRNETKKLVEYAIGTSLNPQQSEEIAASTGGNPLFVVEIVNAKQSYSEKNDNGIKDSSALRLPDKVRTAIQSRLNLLSSDEQEIAMLCAVIGRDFSFEILIRASNMDADKLAATVDSLCQRKIIHEHAIDRYDFRHDLIREVALAAVGASTRRQLHYKIARALQKIFGNDLDPVSSQVAFHYLKANKVADACRFYSRAAFIASSMFAMSDALMYANHSLELLDNLHDSAERHLHELKLQMLCGSLYAAMLGYASEQAAASYRRALDLLPWADELEQELSILYGIWQYHLVQGNYQVATQLALDILDKSQNNELGAQQVIGLSALGVTQIHKGLIIDGLNNTRKSIASFKALESQEQMADVLLLTSSYVGLTQCLLGLIDDFQKTVQEVAAMETRPVTPSSLAFAHCATANFCHQVGESTIANTLLESSENLCQEFGLEYAGLLTNISRLRVDDVEQLTEEQIETLQQQLMAAQKSGARGGQPYFFLIFATAHGRLGNYQAGFEIVKHTLNLINEIDEPVHEAEVRRLYAEFQMKLDPSNFNAAKSMLNKALEVAQNQQAKFYELRVAISLVRLLQEVEDAEQAYILMQNVCDWFPAHVQTPDLVIARELLADW